MKRLKTLWATARRRPFRALYALGVCLLALTLVGNFVLDQLLYAAGVLEETTVTLQNTEQYTLVNMENTGDGLVSTTGDAQLLLNPGALVRRLRLVARYEGGAVCEKDLYYHLPAFGYTSRLRVWPTAREDGSWTYTLPRFAGQGLRLDLADSAGVTVDLTAIVLNERLPWQEYFIPSAWQLFWLAALPGLAGCAVTLKREKGEDE
ncbi:hypothetical protein [Candidatus Allofournierella merdipullorum]|uniref:hypothetical protein n=1 Tax=Candidatus Allofournierella merdipullorum TaxID=2838595 RepID=UPI003AB6C76E